MLITPEYVAQNALLHETERTYGISGYTRASEVIEIINDYGIETVLDYGCGKAMLFNGIADRKKEINSRKLTFQNYDPALPQYAQRPKPADLVVCSDVIEHIEPECLDNVLADIRGLTKVLAYLIIALQPAEKHLPDGRNAHLIIESPAWWLEKISKEFNVWKTKQEKHCLKLVVAPR